MPDGAAGSGVGSSCPSLWSTTSLARSTVRSTTALALSLAAANATLSELARDNGALLAQANKLGRDLMCGLGDAGRRHRVPLQLTGFSAAFSMHFTERSDLRDYRDTLDDDAALLQRVLAAALAEGIHLIPDGRWYVSAAHTPRDIEETVAAFDRALSAVAATP